MLIQENQRRYYKDQPRGLYPPMRSPENAECKQTGIPFYSRSIMHWGTFSFIESIILARSDCCKELVSYVKAGFDVYNGARFCILMSLSWWPMFTMMAPTSNGVNFRWFWQTFSRCCLRHPDMLHSHIQILNNLAGFLIVVIDSWISPFGACWSCLWPWHTSRFSQSRNTS